MRNSFLRLVCIFGLFNSESMERAPKVSLNKKKEYPEYPDNPCVSGVQDKLVEYHKTVKRANEIQLIIWNNISRHTDAAIELRKSEEKIRELVAIVRSKVGECSMVQVPLDFNKDMMLDERLVCYKDAIVSHNEIIAQYNKILESHVKSAKQWEEWLAQYKSIAHEALESSKKYREEYCHIKPTLDAYHEFNRVLPDIHGYRVMKESSNPEYINWFNWERSEIGRAYEILSQRLNANASAYRENRPERKKIRDRYDSLVSESNEVAEEINKKIQEHKDKINIINKEIEEMEQVIARETGIEATTKDHSI